MLIICSLLQPKNTIDMSIDDTRALKMSILNEIQSHRNQIKELLQLINSDCLKENKKTARTFLLHLKESDANLLYSCSVRNENDNIVIKWPEHRIFCAISDGEISVCYVPPNAASVHDVEFTVFHFNDVQNAVADAICLIKKQRE